MNFIKFALVSLIFFSAATPKTAIFDRPSPAAAATLKTLSLDQKIGQLFVIPTASVLTPQVQAVSPYRLDQEYTEELIKEYQPGGLMFLYPGEPEKQAELTQKYQKMSTIPLLIALDAEWGLSMRLKNTPRFPRNMALGALQDPALVYTTAAEIARQLKELGVHMNLAPVVDINSNPANPVIHDRSFGDNPQAVAAKAALFMRGLLDNGIIPCAKHFPGHGDTAVDSHLALPVVEHTQETLEQRELYPFTELIEQGIPAIMTAHLAVPTLDATKTPATLSPKLVNFLRKNLIFNGLIITDGLGMTGVTQGKKPGEVECEALLAGNDVLLCPVDVPEAFEKIKTALAQKKISEAELDEHVLKILTAKEWAFNQADKKSACADELLEHINTPHAYALKKELYSNIITPINFTQNDIVHFGENVAYVQVGAQAQTPYAAMLHDVGNAQEIIMSATADIHEIAEQCKKCDVINIGIFGITKVGQYNGLGVLQEGSHNIPTNVFALIQKLREAHKKVVITLFGSAYSARLFKDEAVLLAYEDDVDAQEAAAKVLYGKMSARGVLPVKI